MKLGIKIGPDPSSITDLEQSGAPFGEVWFRIDKKDDYNNLFTYLQRHTIDTGLHFWGLTRNGCIPGIAHDDQAFLQESMELFRQTIDLAQTYGFSYVNIHPGYRTAVACNFQTMVLSRTKSSVTPKFQATAIFLEHAHLLNEYATSRNVLLTIETTPKRVQSGSLYDPSGRNNPHDLLDYTYIEINQPLPFAVANDFGHTAANCIAQDSKTVWKFLKDITVALVPQTRLLHIGYIVPPFNGTDFHDQLDNPLFHTAHAVPNITQMKELLSLFHMRKNVWALVEPNGHHVKNYQLVKTLLETL